MLYLTEHNRFHVDKEDVSPRDTLYVSVRRKKKEGDHTDKQGDGDLDAHAQVRQCPIALYYPKSPCKKGVP